MRKKQTYFDKKTEDGQIKKTLPGLKKQIAANMEEGKDTNWQPTGFIQRSTVDRIIKRIRASGYNVQESSTGFLITKYSFQDACDWMDKNLSITEPFHWTPYGIVDSAIDTIVEVATQFGYTVTASDGYVFVPPATPIAVHVVKTLHQMEQHLKTHESFNWTPSEDFKSETIDTVLEVAQKAGFAVNVTDGYVFTNPHNAQSNW